MKQTGNVCSLPDDVRNALEEWLDGFNPETAKPLSKGYQGSVWLFTHPKQNVVVKTAPAGGLGKLLLHLTLQHEYRVYAELYGVQGVPRCYGFFRKRFLILEHIKGESLRHAKLLDRDYFYRRFFSLLESLHDNGIAHVDLKRKDNILVVEGREPYLIDFGVAILKSQRSGLINGYLFNVGRRFDYNAWIKHKYNRQYDLVSAEDRIYLRRTVAERFAGWVKKTWKKVYKLRR